MSAELLPCYRCGKAPMVETYDGYPRVSCDCYSGPDAFCATWPTVDGAIQDWNDRMEQEEPFVAGKWVAGFPVPVEANAECSANIGGASHARDKEDGPCVNCGRELLPDTFRCSGFKECRNRVNDEDEVCLDCQRSERNGGCPGCGGSCLRACA